MKKLYVFLLVLLFGQLVYSQIPQTVIVEHFTNSVCSICASRNPAFYDLLQDYPNVLHVAYHPSAPYPSCIFYQSNPAENDARTNYYGVYGSTPRIVIQGEVVAPSSPLMTPMQIEDKLGMMSDYAISFKHFFGDNDTVHAVITVKKVSGPAENGLRLFAVLAEKSIEYNAPNGENLHRDVFRKVISNEDFNLENPGDSITRMVSYVPHSDWNKDEIYVVGMVQKNDDKSVLQAGASGFAESMTGIQNHRPVEISDVFYPNPVTDHLNIRPEFRDEFTRAEIYNLFGKKIRESDAINRIETGQLAKGYYFLVLRGKDGKSYTTKFIKK